MLIVDDEVYVRDKIRDIAAADGCFRVFVAESGVQALKIAAKEQIDAVLLDINMPQMDGISFLKAFRELHEATRVIVVSGYQNFRYVRDAMRLNTMDYIAKPVTPKAARQLLARLAEQLRKDESESAQFAALLQQVQQSRDIITARFYSELLAGTLTTHEIEARAAALDLPIQGQVYELGLLKLDGWRGGKDVSAAIREEQSYQVFLKRVELLCIEFFRDCPTVVTFQHTSCEFVIIAVDLQESFSARLLRLKELITAQTQAAVIASTGERVTRTEDLAQSFRSALQAQAYAVLLGSSCVLCPKDLDGKRQQPVYETDFEQLKLLLKLGQLTPIYTEIRNSFAALEQHSQIQSVQQIYTLSAKLILTLAEALQESELWQDDIFELISQSKQCRSVSEMIAWLNGLFEKYAALLQANKDTIGTMVAKQMKKYIKEHYHCDVTVAAIAAELGYSQNYLGHVFKNSVGYSVAEYLNLARVQVAKQLLKTTQKKVYEIAYEVGYHDNNYFCTIFKRITQFTPSEFRAI